MSGWSTLGMGARAALLAGGAACAGGVAYVGWSLSRPAAPPPTAIAAVQPAPPPVKTPAKPDPIALPAPVAKKPEPPPPPGPASRTAAAEPAAAPPKPSDLKAPPPKLLIDHPEPAFDVVRVETDGSALVAGRAVRGATVTVLVDGAEIQTTTADPGGRFAVLFDMAPDGKPHRVTLRMALADGSQLASTESVLVAALTPLEEMEDAETASAPTALLVSETGVRVMQPEGEDVTEPVTGVTIDTIAYAADGAVLLSGRGTPADYVRIYLDNAEKITVPISAEGAWNTSLPLVPPGLYTLRADQLDASGTVVARFETPFKRETDETIAAALEAQGDLQPAAASADPAVPAPPASEGAPALAIAPDAPPALAAPGSPGAVAAADAAAGGPITVTVQPGFTLWRIAEDNFGSGIRYVQVYEANRDRIRDADLIYPGQVFTLPSRTD
ncbi:peptigoglycan-binding protein LysM [Cereibacter changlensis JA139]|uniref:Peptigoglycan-binding protein LysM n=2 Tax=Cereibacter changlensis TaxID=402884 RepID=A0A2T4JVU5_9RHOB|nr:LysM peptidoglycan-binding domain-containing protein [Cereibacter changlensis]PTE22005.1 peptigoglycan-binding protein LysM [Cereibacter changlensis JA139]